MAEVVTEFHLTWYDSSRAGRLALLSMHNGRDHRRPNTFGEGALRSLGEALDEVEAAGDARGLMLTGKPFIFAVGADLEQFAGADADFARRAGALGHEVFGRLRDLPFPTLAAVNGACMGGGLEIALHCDVRTVASSAAPIGFPEVFLSIIPAWGGTQMAPRIAGGPNALRVIVGNALDNNRTLKARQAVELGLVDRLLPAVDFFEESLAWLERIVAGEEPSPADTRSLELEGEELDEALDAARKAADGRTHGATDAPYRAIDLIEHAARGGDLAEGLRREEDALAELLPARQAQASVYAFDLTQNRVKRQPWAPDAGPRKVRKAAIVGSGLMGAQLGALFLRRLKVPLVMKDVDRGVLDRAKETIEGDLLRAQQRGRLSEAEVGFLAGLVTYTVEDEPLRGADVVLEAVAESLDLKRRIFADVETQVDEGAVLLSNTSSLSITEMAAQLAHPGRVVGLHFFNPVSVLPLVEVIAPEGASDEAAATAYRLAKDLGKSAVGSADRPAFIVNRVLARFMGACAQAVTRGASFHEVDDAITALGLPMGPFDLLGLVGLRVSAHVGEILEDAFGERFAGDENLQRVAELEVPGIYDAERVEDGRPQPYPAVVEAWKRDEGAQPPDAGTIRREALEAVADECKRMLDDGTVADARDIDTALILGAGWPFFTGGICMYLDQTGVSERVFGGRLVGAKDRATA